MRPAEPQGADRPLPELLRQLATDTGTLVRQEVELAKAELSQKAKEATATATSFGAAAIFGLGAFGALTTAVIAALNLVLPLWAAALVVTVIYAAGAAAGVARGRTVLKKIGTPVPEQTVATVRGDVETVRAAVKRSR